MSEDDIKARLQALAEQWERCAKAEAADLYTGGCEGAAADAAVEVYEEAARAMRNLIKEIEG